MPKSPESEILAKLFADMGEKCGEHLPKKFADCRPSISREIGRKKLHGKSSATTTGHDQKNPGAHKNKIGTSPPPPNPNYPPPWNAVFLWTQVFLQKERIFPGVHKIGAAISGPRIADTNFMDTRIFLTWNKIV